MKNYDSSKNWQFFLNRPFGLFECSIWYEWYKLYSRKELAQLKSSDALFIEEAPKLVRHYRIKEDMEDFNKSIENLIRKNREKCVQWLKKGQNISDEAKDKIKKGKEAFTLIQDAIDFLMKTAIFTITFPHVLRNTLEKSNITDDELVKLSEDIRKESHYPGILKEIIKPMALDILKRKDDNFEISDLDFITYNELLNDRIDVISERKSSHSKERFIYEIINDKEKICWTNSPGKIISELENLGAAENKFVMGQIACKGYAKGIARIITTIDGKGANFNNGDILITINSNPNLMTLIKKAAAIIADEGGVASHASIISRELNIPCIIATKNATKIIKDGDYVEVDANEGVVKIIKSKK